MCCVRSLRVALVLLAAFILVVALAALPAVSAATETSRDTATEATVLAIEHHARMTPNLPVGSAITTAMLVLVVAFASERIRPRHAGRVVDVGEAWRALLLRAPPWRG